MMAMAVQAGEEISTAEVVELMANTRSLYNLSTLLSRDFDRIAQCHALWQQTTTQFEALCQAWEGVPQDGEMVGQHRAHLRRLLELSADRCELYSITEKERRTYAANREIETETSFGTRGDIEPVREFSKLEAASIERAYRKL